MRGSKIARDVVKILPSDFPSSYIDVLLAGETIDPAIDGLFEIAAYFPGVNMGRPSALVLDRAGLAIQFPMERLRIQLNLPHDYDGPTGQLYKPETSND